MRHHDPRQTERVAVYPEPEVEQAIPVAAWAVVGAIFGGAILGWWLWQAITAIAHWLQF